MNLTDGALIAAGAAAAGALVAAGRALQRVKALEDNEVKTLKSFEALARGVMEHVTTGGIHRSAEWEDEVRRRLGAVDVSIELIRSKMEEDRGWLAKNFTEIRVDLARISPASTR
jgi:hypothetical protein